jgi:hypothetical protein
MDLEIKYDNGHMIIHVKEFLGQRSISKFRKLIKLINNSYTPELLDDLKSYILNQLEQFEQNEQTQEEFQRYVTGYEQKIDYSNRGIYTATTYRSRYKKGSEAWEHHNEKLKQFREENKELKRELRQYVLKSKDNVRNKDFYSKCIKIMQG